MSNGIEIKNLPFTTAIKQGDTMTIVQDKQNKQLSLDVFANESDLATLSPLENRCDEVKAKIEVDEYSAEITTSQSMSKIGSDDSGVDLHENVLDGAFESCVLKGKTKYRDIDTGEILEDFEEGRNLELIMVRMPILSTVGKNLLPYNEMFVSPFTSATPYITKNVATFPFTLGVNGRGVGIKFKVEPNTTYTLSSNVVVPNTVVGVAFYKNESDTTNYNNNLGIAFSTNIEESTKTFTTPNECNWIVCGMYILYTYEQSGGTVVISEMPKLQLEKNTQATTYEPHKSSILSLPEEVVLRSLPDGTCDTLNVETGEYVQKIGERNYQDGDTNSNTLVTDGTKTHYKLSSAIITKVDVQGFPHAYKNGYIQLSSGSTEPSLTPTVTYKVPVSRVGQIASNTKSNLRQTIKLDQLEILAYQSLINAEYENLLVQNSAESAASFTNLSTNDPKDELYYILKHLIEENQPVQNMLDKINLFYLYGLLSDEHYFDLLLGGEEDVY